MQTDLQCRLKKSACLFLLAAILAAAPFVSSYAADDEVTPGVLQEERSKLLQSIKDMEKKGVGIKPYSQAFARIDEMVKKGATEPIIQLEVDRLKDHVSGQWKTTSAAKEVSRPPVGQMTASQQSMATYIGPVQTVLRKKWKPVKGVDDKVCINFSVDAAGNISDAKLDTDSKGSQPCQDRVLNIVKGLGKLPAPPANFLPLELQVLFCDDHGVEVYRKNIDFSLYMADLQRQIKRAWFPPKGLEDKAVTVRFKVMTDGALKNTRIFQSTENKVVDEACMKALEVASPVRPLPAGAPHQIDVEFKFDYHAPKK